MYKSVSTLLVILFFVSGTAACSQTPFQEATLTPVLAVEEKTRTPGETPSPTDLPTQAVTSKPLATWTPLATLPQDEARSTVAELLETNANCRLPCWWGIVPGTTTWYEAKQFLAQLAIDIGYSRERKDSFYANLQVPPPSGSIRSAWGDIPYLTQDYEVVDNVVESIIAYNFDIAPEYFLPAFLASYGEPGEIGIQTFKEEEQNSQPFLLSFFYPEKGILMVYSGCGIVNQDDRIINCLNEMNSPEIYLWNPDQDPDLNFTEAFKRFVNYRDLPFPIDLETATGKDVHSFYEAFMREGVVCIETPKELWP